MGEGRVLNKLASQAKAINLLEGDFAHLSNDELRDETEELRARYTAGESLDDLLPEAFAAVREASRRTLGLRHFDVQLMGAGALHLGSIAEMKTGEGKTLSAAPALILNALTGKGSHLITVNDYLAQRDAGWMAPIYNLLGISVAVIYSGKVINPLPFMIQVTPTRPTPTKDFNISNQFLVRKPTRLILLTEPIMSLVLTIFETTWPEVWKPSSALSPLCHC